MKEFAILYETEIGQILITKEPEQKGFFDITIWFTFRNLTCKAEVRVEGSEKAQAILESYKNPEACINAVKSIIETL